MNTSKKKHIVFFHNIDAWRFMAALAVICYHMTMRYDFPETAIGKRLEYLFTFGYNGGWIGVNFFFVLSGFLITYLMYSEASKENKLNIPYFYLRRVLRIWPLYFVSIILGFLIIPYLKHFYLDVVVSETANPFWYSTFLTNFDHLFHKFPNESILGVQWSVAVEEQFYLLWPLLFSIGYRIKAFHWIVITIILLSNIWRIINIDDYELTYYHTFAALNELGIGALASYIAFYKTDKLVSFFNALNKVKTLIIYALGMCLVIFKPQLMGLDVIKCSYRFIMACFFSFIILEQNYSSNSFYKLGRIKVFNYLGKISYGLYLLHMVSIVLINQFIGTMIELNLFYKIILTLIITIALSAISYELLEKPFLKLKSKFSFITKGKA